MYLAIDPTLQPDKGIPGAPLDGQLHCQLVPLKTQLEASDRAGASTLGTGVMLPVTALMAR